MLEKRLLRETVATFWRILPVFAGNGFGELGPSPLIGYSVKHLRKLSGKGAGGIGQDMLSVANGESR